jgi:hypothetical protein
VGNIHQENISVFQTQKKRRLADALFYFDLDYSSSTVIASVGQTLMQLWQPTHSLALAGLLLPPAISKT